MTSGSTRELLLRVFHQQPVDRIPVSPFIHVNHVKEFFESNEVDWVSKTPEVYAHYGFDLIHRNCSAVFDAYGPPGPEWSMKRSQTQTGRDLSTVTTIHTPQGDLRCREELHWVHEYDAEASPVEYPIKTKTDFECFLRYQPPPAEADVSDIKKAKKLVGAAGVTAPWIQGAFNLVAYHYRKIDELLLDVLLDHDFYRAMMEHFLARYKIFVQQLIAAGADVLSYGANIANGKLVGREFFQKHIWPFEKDLIDFIQGQGVPVLYHNCGYARNLIPLYPSLGLRAYESLTPTPYGDTVLAEAVRAFGLGTTLMGGIDQLDVLRTGTPQELECAVRRVLDTVRGRCHFILGTSDYFNENTPQEKIFILAEAGHRYGML